MTFDRFFALAKEKGIAQSQIHVVRSNKLSIRLFHHEIDSYTIADSQTIIACGIYNGKFGSASTEKLGKDTFDYLVNQIILTATYSEKMDEVGIFEGSEKYKKANVYKKELKQIPVSTKLADLRKLEDAIYAASPLVSDANGISYGEIESSTELYNSHGLKLKQKTNYFIFSAGAVLRKEEEVKTYYDYFFGNDYGKFNPETMAKTIVEEGLKKFGGVSCPSGKYPTVLDRDVFASLIDAFLSSAIADEIQRHSSFLEGKLGQKIVSSKLTIEERPLTKGPSYTYFDDEGVAAYNKTIVKKGVLNSLFYNRETAKKDGVTSTGNGSWQGSKIGTSYASIYVKPGKASFADMISSIKDGVYITEVEGLGTGLNANSGDFSCQAEGFRIRDGKLAEPLNLITLSGNLLKMLNDLKALDNRINVEGHDLMIPDAFIKSMAIGGE